MPLQATSGAASYDAFGGGVPVVPVYIEQIFSTYLYTGNNSTQTITNNIDLSTKGGLVWIKGRNSTTIVPNFNNILYDTARGVYKTLQSNTTDEQGTSFTGLTAFTTSGFSLGSASQTNLEFDSDIGHYASWTFRKQPKFFDVVTYTGTGSAQAIAHNLGSVPACIIVKRTNSANNWNVYHRGTSATPQNDFLTLNTTAASVSDVEKWNNTAPTSTNFTVGIASTTNASGGTYVAYLFAHNAGGFGLTGTDNVISCGSYVETTGANAVNLGYEPQWLLVKNASVAEDWWLIDTMRGMTAAGQDALLRANTSGTELSAGGNWYPTATGFANDAASGSGDTYIYIAIRRGPMKVPTSGTSVFKPMTRTGTAAAATVTGAGFTPDSVLIKDTSSGGRPFVLNDRLRGVNNYLLTSSTGNEATVYSTWFGVDNSIVLGMDGYSIVNSAQIINANPAPLINYFFRRAPSFFDEVCYTGTGSATSFAHNLTVVPELMIVKRRSGSGAWMVNSQYLAADARLEMQSTSAVQAPPEFGDVWNNTRPTSTVFTVGTDSEINASGGTYVNYLFATCAGVSKVFSYTGNGSSQTINCGFTGGARWILIKRTDSTGDWYCWDSARGIVSGNDPHLSLNTTAAEVTSDDTIDTDSTGFVVNQVSATNVNVSSATYIGIAIA